MNYLPDRPPPPGQTGIIAWLSRHLFSSWGNSALTLFALLLLYLTVPPVLSWALIHADWAGQSAADCSRDGAPQFTDWVAAGRYKKRSASFYTADHPSNPTPGKPYLRHVGFLGAQPPAVKGLADFAGTDEPVYEFADLPDPPQQPLPHEETMEKDEELKKKEQELNEREKALAKKEAELKRKEAELEAEEAAREEAEAADFAEGLVKTGVEKAVSH